MTTQLNKQPEGSGTETRAEPGAAAGGETNADTFVLTKDAVFEALKPVIDPEIRLSIIDLGLVYDAIITNEGKAVDIHLTLTTPMCPYGPMLLTQVQDVANTLPGVEEAKVTLVWEPTWDPRTMASDYAKDKLNIW